MSAMGFLAHPTCGEVPSEGVSGNLRQPTAETRTEQNVPHASWDRPEGAREGTEGSETIMTTDFSTLLSDIKPQTQEAQGAPRPTNAQKIHQRQIDVSFLWYIYMI